MKQSGQCLLYEHCDLRAISAREDVIPVLLSRHPSAQTTWIQKSLLVSKQTSIESGYNIFDEIIWKTGSQCLGTGMTKEDVIPVPSTDHLLCNLPSKMNVRTAME
ncbi:MULTISPECIES: hypothetical protein [unclassified Wolbachia]|uniref:hypothetical protein n=1 Tax=unclassified Wolbachia TaxID=2640676 RepID=UPI001F3369AF|nr:MULTISPECIES: hypothetical protein [unclassified Wolbachia]MCX3065841.1 hypothetical protein [Wolbachia endosymbiont of Drosophila pseudotakahashii]UJQ21188.1 hypothetical protein L2227_00990 [Wolbachia endosymbiont of Delia radicum]UZE38057.1 hypothetical protein ONI09_03930 [Wolbachia endosymbiont of Drosophila pseudotakahashii]